MTPRCAPVQYTMGMTPRCAPVFRIERHTMTWRALFTRPHAKAKFMIGSKTYNLAANNGPNTLHGRAVQVDPVLTALDFSA